MTEDLNKNILNLKPPVPPSPNNEPYKLTFTIDNDTNNGPKQLHQLTDFTETNVNSYYDDDVVVESYETPLIEHTKLAKLAARNRHDTHCILSAFLYFITITTFAYLFILWIKQKMHVQMQLMNWW